MQEIKEQKLKTGLSRLLELAFTRKMLIIPALLLSALSALSGFIPYLAIYRIIRRVINVYPHFSAADEKSLILYGWIAAGAAVGNVLLYFAALLCSHLAAFGTLYELKLNFASHLTHLPLGFCVRIGSGKLRKIMDEDIEKLETFIAHQLPDITAAYVAPVILAGVLLWTDPLMGAAVVAGIILSFIMQGMMFGKKDARELMERYQHNLGEMNNAAVEYTRGMSVVKVFGQTVNSFKKFCMTIRDYTDTVIEYTLKWENPMSLFMVLINNLYLFVLPVGIVRLAAGEEGYILVPKIIFYLILVPSASGILMRTLYMGESGMKVMSGINSMDEVLSEDVLPEPKKDKSAHVSEYSVVFKDVHFNYPNGSKALRGMCFRAGQNKLTAIVGASGSGKSTIAHLIPRFFDVSSGNIEIGGVDICEISSDKLMDMVSFVFQDIYLFRQSIADNIRMGRKEAVSDEIIRAAKAACCHDFITNLPAGYDTVIGRDGIQLSGGERQRIAIARAIVRNTPIVVLDEATAFSDTENEYLIQQAISELVKGKTVIVIAHRLSTVKNADKIVVLDSGIKVEEGTHDILLKKNGIYAKMWQRYTAAKDWKIESRRKRNA